MQLFLLFALVGSFAITLVACGIVLRLFPNFRSGERKEGFFRADQSLGGSGHSLVNGKGRRVSSSELPLVGSRAMIPAMLIAGGITGWVMQFDEQQWNLLIIFGSALVGFWFVGFLDDWKKVHSGQGIREITKFVGVAIVSAGVGIALNRMALWHLIDLSHFPYSPYIDAPGLGQTIDHVRGVWPILFVVLTMTVATTTSLAVDFADGLDGLAGGLIFPAALAFAVIILNEENPEHYPMVVASLALAGASLGFLPWNWPSSWRGKNSAVPRRARMIMGDSGSLSLGGLLGVIAIADRQELLLILIGGVFVIEGLSAVIQSRLLVRFFRKFLRVERFSAEGTWFPHTEFPLPFLATPLHHHFDLLGWDRRRLVYGAWTIGAIFAALSVSSALAPFTWERYLTRIIGLLIGLVLWQSGQYTRGYFLGTVATQQGKKLALFYGYPYRIFGRPLYALVEQTEASARQVSNAVEQGVLWVRMNVFDARAVLGFFCFRAGYYALAREQWERIPFKNLAVRPQIQELLTEARRRLAGPTMVSEAESAGTIETAMGAEPSPADSSYPSVSITGGAVTGPLQTGPLHYDASTIINPAGIHTLDQIVPSTNNGGNES